MVEGSRGSAGPALGGAAAVAALIGAFGFTNWQNSNETEVYSVATFTTAAHVLGGEALAPAGETERAPSFLLLIVYLAGISIGNHLLALLAVPGDRGVPGGDPLTRVPRRSGSASREWGQVAVLAGVWALLIGTGLGSTGLIAVGRCASSPPRSTPRWAARACSRRSLAIAAVGVTPYLYLYIRSAQHPVINEAASSRLMRCSP